MFVFDFGKYAYLHHPDVICSLFKKKYTYLNRLVVVCFDFKKVCWLTSPRRCLFLILKSMLTGYLERDHLMGLCWHTFKKYADRLFRKIIISWAYVGILNVAFASRHTYPNSNRNCYTISATQLYYTAIRPLDNMY